MNSLAQEVVRTNGGPVRGSYKVSVMVKSSRTWADNGLRFYTQSDASDYASALKRRWPAVDKAAVVICDDPPNCVFPVPSDRYPVIRPDLPVNTVLHPCPNCKEANADKLVWMPDDTTVACLSCGHQFIPGRAKDVPNG